jgi:protein-disulfide isomerase
MKNIINKLNDLSIPVAIIIAGVIIGTSIVVSSKINQKNLPLAVNTAGQQPAPQPSDNLEAVKKVSKQDHIRGNPNAPITIVEYSDTECPFCKQFHQTMKQIIAEYGNSGKVAWVYRNFPLDQLHPKARKEAEALECANELGGNDKFWEYTDRLYEITPANNGLEESELPKIAQYVGLDVQKFNSCLSSGKYAKKVEDDVKNATETGGNGTPWSIVITKDGKKYPLSGAQPYASVKQMIEGILNQK